jgi:CRP-like cAMP-binding protein
MFIIVNGSVAVSIHTPAGDQEVTRLGRGEIVGEMSLMTGARRSATVKAVNQVEAVEVTKAALEALLANAPGLIRRFAEMMEQRRAELDNIHKDAQRWNQIGLTPPELVARMTAFYSG